MKLLNTPDSTDDEDAVLEDELVILDDDQVEQLLQNVQESIENNDNEMDTSDVTEASQSGTEAGTEMSETVNEVDDASLVMKAHTDAVFCVAVDLNGDFAASGGQDDVAYIWKIENGQCVHKCEGHEESVTGVAFNCDGSLLATGDMSGIIQVWQRDESNQWKLFWKRHEVSELQWLSWHPKVKNCLIAGSDESPGNIFLWSVSPSNTKCKILAGIGTGCVDGRVLSDGLTLVSIYQSPILRVWNIPQATATNTITLGIRDTRRTDDELDRSPTCLAIKLNQDSTNSNIIAVGNAAGEIILIHSSQWQIIATIWCNRRESVESIAFSNMHPYAAFGTVNGLFGVIDLSTLKIRYVRENEHGFSRLRWLGTSLNVLSASLNGSIVIWDVRNGTEIKQLRGHRDSVLDVVVFANDTRILSCGDTDDRCLRLFHND